MQPKRRKRNTRNHTSAATPAPVKSPQRPLPGKRQFFPSFMQQLSRSLLALITSLKCHKPVQCRPNTETKGTCATYPFEKAANCEEESAIATSLRREDLVEAVLSHSWDSCVTSTMGVIADRDDCPLLAVPFMFDLGDAAYHSNPTVQGDHEMFALFERIQKRINAGGVYASFRGSRGT